MMKVATSFVRLVLALCMAASAWHVAASADIRYSCSSAGQPPGTWQKLGEHGEFRLLERDFYAGMVCWLQVHDDEPAADRSQHLLTMDGVAEVMVTPLPTRPGEAPASVVWRSARSVALAIPPSGDVFLRLDDVLPISSALHPRIEPATDFLQRDGGNAVLRASLLSLLAVMGIGGILFAIAMRDAAIAWYAGLTLSLSIMWAILQGMAVGPTGLALHAPRLVQMTLLASYGVALCCAINFGRRFNRTPQAAPRLDAVLLAVAWGIAAYTAVGFIPAATPWVFNFFNLIGMLGMVSMLVPGAWSLRAHDYRTGLLYLAGWLPVVMAWIGLLLRYVDQIPDYPPVLGQLAHGLTALGLLPNWLASPNVRQAALVIQAAIFSVALADQAAYLRRRRERSAMTDNVTALPNRASFLMQARAMFEDEPRTARTVLVLDIERFAAINETLGYEVGDAVLRETGRRLQRKLGVGTLVARLGGNQFGLLLDEVAPETALRLLTGGLTRQPLEIEGNRLDVSLCGGAADYPQHGGDIELLLRRAEIALAHAKEEKQALMRYRNELERDRRFQLSLLSALRTAITTQQLKLCLQPKVEVSTGRVCGAEALIRWAHPELGEISPGEFLPFAEQTGLIVELSRWAIEEAFGVARDWQQRGLNLRLSINLSAIDLNEASLPAFIVDFLRRSGADPGQICLELTESEVMRDPKLALDNMRALRKLGFQLSLDDFGTGNSALSYLQDMPVHEVKIDRSFILNTRREGRGRQLLHAITELCRALGLRVVAEGVETAEDWEASVATGCDEVQGYYVSRPLPVAEFDAWLTNGQRFAAKQGSVEAT
ncbi:MAG: EAL domain-containing protein [Burkholderiales bacterium]|nr:EAL domain-containing protein [Burkholderiales bacterium]